MHKLEQGKAIKKHPIIDIDVCFISFLGLRLLNTAEWLWTVLLELGSRNTTTTAYVKKTSILLRFWYHARERIEQHWRHASIQLLIEV